MKASNKQAPERGMNQTPTEELIKQLENRLDWLTSQPAEDMNEEEIENILNLLDTLKPLPSENTFNPEEAFERLEKDYLHNPEKLEQASEEADRAELIAALREKAVDTANPAKRNTSEKAMPIPTEESETEAESTEKKHTAVKKHRHFRVLKNMGIAAAIMILVFSGLNLATYATAKKGLFDLIINRKNTMSNMYVGDGDMGMEHEVMEKEKYTSWDDVPDEIKNGILLSDYIPDGMELEKIEIMGFDPMRIEINYKMCENSQQYLHIAIRQFDNLIVKNQITYPDAEYQGSEKVGEIEYYIYKNDIENIFIFMAEDNIYYIYSNLSVKDMEKIIEMIS